MLKRAPRGTLRPRGKGSGLLISRSGFSSVLEGLPCPHLEIGDSHCFHQCALTREFLGRSSETVDLEASHTSRHQWHPSWRSSNPVSESADDNLRSEEIKSVWTSPCIEKDVDACV